MTKNLPIFTIFLSSPSDVPQERDDAQAVVDAFNKSHDYDDMFATIRLYRWEGEVPPSVKENAQKTVNKYLILPSECDLVVVIFWTRMGTPTVIDGREYLSGTDYEYTEALESGKPEIFVYHCLQDDPISRNDPDRDEKNRQFDTLDQYIKKIKYDQKKLIQGYPTHPDFKTEFENYLRKHLQYLRKHPQALISEREKTPTKPKIDVPYKGLRPLREEDVPIFFGRTAEASDVLTRIGNKRLVPVLGASGSGKSSLIMAGVLPQLTKQGWRVIQCVPSNQPFDQLALAIVSQIPEMRVSPIDYLNESAKLAIILRQNPQNVVAQLRAVLPNQRIVIYIDQFEELFTVSEKSAIAPFIGAIRHEAQDITTIITMRADFYETALAHVDELTNETYGLKKPSIFALYEMITRPAIEAGYILDDGLAGRIIDDIGEDSGALALVAYVMETMYLRAKARGDKHITHADYEALGGVQGAINTLAEKAYAELPFDDKETVLRNVFFHLITLTADENGQLVPTRHRYPLGNFPKNSPERVLIDRFVMARLLVTDSTMVEVAHEAILRHWEQLKAWIDANKVSMAVYRQFERDASAWAENPDSTPLPLHESLQYFYKAIETINKKWSDLGEPLKTYTISEQQRLVGELDDIETSSARRYSIGARLSLIGDAREGIGLLSSKIPDIQWCYIQNGGSITIEKYSFAIAPFYVSTYPITNLQFNSFLMNGYSDLELWGKFLDIFDGGVQNYTRIKEPVYNYCPSIDVSWYQSVVFSKWLDRIYRRNKLFQKIMDLDAEQWQIRLPTEWEWQWMAQNGDENRLFSWRTNSLLLENSERDDFDDVCINWFFSGINRTLSVGMYPQNKAKCGALDVLGNVWEWCINDYEPINEIGFNPSNEKSVKGGSFLSKNITTHSREAFSPIGFYNDVGFRLIIAQRK